MADTTTELEVLDEIVEVLGGTPGQYETVVPTLQQILALLGGEGIPNAVEAALAAHPEWTTTVQDGSITGPKIADDTIPDAKLAQTGGVLERVAGLTNDLQSITIENYDHPWVEDSTPVTTGAYYAIRNVVSSNAGWSYKEIECEPNTDYVISGSRGTDARLYIVLNANQEVIASAESSTSNAFATIEYTTPADAKYLIVNCKNSEGIPSIKAQDALTFVLLSNGSDVLTVTKGEGDLYTIEGGGYSTIVNLSGSANGLFNFQSMNYGGALFKECHDDVTPVNFVGAGYVGANHGFYFGYECVATNHGLTDADIGKTMTDGINTWVLLKVNSADSVTVGCYDESAWYRLKAVAPSALDFGSSIAIESATRGNIYPSVKNGNVSVIEEGVSKFLILETYDIIEIGTGIDALMENVGSNTNESLVSLSDSAVTVRNLYEFRANGSVTIYQNLKVLKDYVTLNFYGGVQSMPFGSSDSYMVPQTTKRGIWPSEQINFSRSMWSDQSVPPTLYIQIDNNANNYSRIMLTGFVGPNRNADIAVDGGFISAARKMYPYMLNPNATVAAGKTYSMVSFRVPTTFRKYSNVVPIVGYAYVYDDIYLFIYAHLAANTSIKLPEFMWGKRCEVVMADGVTCETSNIIDSVDVRSGANYGSIILKLSD